MLTFGHQVGIEKGRVAHLVVGVIRNILRHVAIEILKREYIGRISAVHPAEFVVLLPEIALNQFCCGQKSKDRNITLGKFAAVVFCQQLTAWQHSAGNPDALQKRAPSDDVAPLMRKISPRWRSKRNVLQLHVTNSCSSR